MLKIGAKEIPCYVLEDGRRVLAQNGMIDSLGMSRGGSNKRGGDRLAKFAAGKALEPFASNKLRDVTHPFKFKTPAGAIANGYEATVLADLCETVLAARRAGVLQKQQLHIADQCEILIRGFARVGIIALVDEATGYQYDRPRKALEEILEKFIAKELVAWARRFPEEFYENLFRLKGWRHDPGSSKRPMLFARLTVELVYERLAPGVLDELRRLSPKGDKGRRKNKLHQWLSTDVGHPKLREHFIALNTLMKACDRYGQFEVMVNRVLPRYNVTMELPFPMDDEFEDQD